MKNNNNNNEEQPLFKSMSKNVETRSMPKNKSAETPESHFNLSELLNKRNNKK